jgi:ABC-type dipeptide/oligopeptide/nickel transport system permease component
VLRLTRNSIAENRESDHVRTATAKGLPRRRVIHHGAVAQVDRLVELIADAVDVEDGLGDDRPSHQRVLRLTRNSIAENRESDHVRTATAKGLPRRRVITVHASPKWMPITYWATKASTNTGTAITSRETTSRVEFLIQFLLYLKGVVTLDLGDNFSGRPIMSVIADTFPTTNEGEHEHGHRDHQQGDDEQGRIDPGALAQAGDHAEEDAETSTSPS